MKRDTILTDELLEFCGEINVDLVGFADPNYFNRYPQQFRPETYLTGVQTVVIVGFHLFDLGLDAWCLGNESGSFQFVDQILVLKCSRIRKFLINKGYNSKTISYKAGLYLKEAAALAGIGSIGRNNLLITEDYGPQVRFRAVVTDAPLICGTPINESKYCSSCDLCIEACPASAFPNGVYNKELCNNYGYSNLKIVSNYTSIWCNKCIEVCPVGSMREIETQKYDTSRE
ncbi:MAG: epoxyqueuosine reductase [Spirochaetes bacterium]|nr:epoxyqueuosine reductase [Spirochaetota bacterium]